MLSLDNIQVLNNIAVEAGNRILDIYNSGSFDVELKSDDSPLTRADKKAHKYIVRELSILFPDIPILSEEHSEIIAYKERKKWGKYWLVDPLDGTKEFIKRNDQFTVNIALIVNNQPVFGVVYAPAISTLYYAGGGEGAYKQVGYEKQKLPIEKAKEGVERVLVSNSHLNSETKDYIASLFSEEKKIEYVKIGSSLKFCLLAEGSADVYPRLGPTMEWDTAAAHAILKAVGKNIYEFDGNNPIRYNKENLLNPFFIAR